MANTHSAFAVHMLNTQGKLKAQVIAEEFSNLLTRLEADCDLGSDGRLRSIVITKMEEACFFAKKTMANNPVNQEP